MLMINYGRDIVKCIFYLCLRNTKQSLFTLDFGNVLCKSEKKPKNLDENVKKNFGPKENTVPETFPTPPQVSMCSSPLSVRGEDDDTPYSLTPQFSRNSSPMFFSPDEVRIMSTLHYFFVCTLFLLFIFVAQYHRHPSSRYVIAYIII